MNQATILYILLLPALGGIFTYYFIKLWDEWRER